MTLIKVFNHVYLQHKAEFPSLLSICCPHAEIFQTNICCNIFISQNIKTKALFRGFYHLYTYAEKFANFSEFVSLSVHLLKCLSWEFIPLLQNCVQIALGISEINQANTKE